jgi:hypothetical protein
MQPVRAFGHDIQFQVPGTPVPVQDLMAPRLQEIAGHLFSYLSNLATLLYVHILVIGFSQI